MFLFNWRQDSPARVWFTWLSSTLYCGGLVADLQHLWSMPVSIKEPPKTHVCRHGRHLLVHLPWAHNPFCTSRGWAQQSSLFFVSQAWQNWYMNTAQHLNPSRASDILALPETCIWCSEMSIRTCSCVYMELWGPRFGCVKIKALEAALCRDTAVEQVPSKKQNETVWPQKREQEAASFRFLAPDPHKDQQHLLCWIPGDAPVYLYNCPFQA